MSEVEEFTELEICLLQAAINFSISKLTDKNLIAKLVETSAKVIKLPHIKGDEEEFINVFREMFYKLRLQD